MKILVAGGTGLIGTNLVLELADQGHKVAVLTRSPDQETPFPDSVRLVKWDALTPEGWLDDLEAAEVVINLAGENIAGKGFFPQPWTAERRESILNSRLKVGKALVSGFQRVKSKPDLLLQASAVGIYGSQSGDRELTEDSPTSSGFLAEVCRAWEDTTLPVEELGVRRAVCRLGIVLDPRGGALKRMLLPFKLFVGGPFGSGKQWYSWIHIDDVSRAMLHLIQARESSGVYNFTSPNPVTNREFARILGMVLNRPSWIRVPGFVLRALFGEVASVVLEGQRVKPENLLDSGYAFRFPDLQPGLQDLVG